MFKSGAANRSALDILPRPFEAPVREGAGGALHRQQRKRN